MGNLAYPQPAQAEVETRAIAQIMTGLASQIGDLETAARALAGRISPLIPGGSPFERPEKAGRDNVTTAVAPAHSHLCDELHARVYSLQQITETLNVMVRAVEI